MEIGEGVDARGPAAPKNRVPIKVRVTLFFDGTGNNRVNTQHREQNDWTYWWMRHAVPGKTDSYENDYSNVARLAENLEDRAPSYDAYVRVYTEGIGTVDSDTDERLGLGTGTGFTGVMSKVAKGVWARGWYDPGRRELSYSPGYSGTYVPYGGRTADVPPSVTAHRAAIARAYTFIPLGIMADFLKHHAIPVKKAKLEAAYDAEDVPGRTWILSYAQRIGLPGASPPETVSRPRDWNDNMSPDLQQLRHDYLHTSFRVELGRPRCEHTHSAVALGCMRPLA